MCVGDLLNVYDKFKKMWWKCLSLLCRQIDNSWEGYGTCNPGQKLRTLSHFVNKWSLSSSPPHPYPDTILIHPIVDLMFKHRVEVGEWEAKTVGAFPILTLNETGIRSALFVKYTTQPKRKRTLLLPVSVHRVLQSLPSHTTRDKLLWGSFFFLPACIYLNLAEVLRGCPRKNG